MKFAKVVLLSLGLTVAPALHAQLYIFTTIAGNAGYGSTDGTNSATRFNNPVGVTLGTNGVYYLTDSGNSTIRQMVFTGGNWVVTTIAGTLRTPGNADGVGTAATFNSPNGIVADKSNNLYVADYSSSIIRKLTQVGTNWVVTTIAGTPFSFGHTDGTNTAALFNGPSGLAVDTNGVLYVTDYVNALVRSLTPSGTNWITRTLAGTALSYNNVDGTNSVARFYGPGGIVVGTGGNLFVADIAANTIRKLSPNGTNWAVTTIAGTAFTASFFDGTNNAALFNQPFGISTGTSGELYVADHNNDVVRKLTPSGTNWISSTLAGLATVTGSGDGTNSGARFYLLDGVLPDGTGKLVVTDPGNNLIRRMTPSGTNWVVDTIAGLAGGFGTADGTNTSVRFNVPVGIVRDTNGDLYLGDWANNTIRKLTPSGPDWISTTIAGVGQTIGHTDGTNNAILFYRPEELAIDKSNNLYVADLGNQIIRKLTPVGTNWVSSTIAGTAGVIGEVDGTNGVAQFNAPFGIALGTNGSLFVADSVGQTVRKLTPVGTNWVVTTIAGTAGVAGHADGTNNTTFNGLSAIVVDAVGNIYVADYSNDLIRKITPVGTNWVVSTIAGKALVFGTTDGFDTVALFNHPVGIGIDYKGSLFVTEDGNYTIRRLTPVGTNWVVVTVGGIPTSQGTEDGLTGAARFYRPQGIVPDTAGNLWIADSYNCMVRKGTPVSSPTPFFTSESQANGTFSYSWAGAWGYLYQMEASTNLTNWVTLGGLAFATNSTVSGIDPLAANPQQFYRVHVYP